jgi:hypothetical protein
VGSKGAEGYGGGAVEAAYCPPVDAHFRRVGSVFRKRVLGGGCCEYDRVVWVN